MKRTRQIGPNGESRRSHPLRTLWYAMKSRCENPNHTSFKHYGAKGIAVCERWQSFWAFVQDVSPRPSRKHTLDRIDRNRGYEPCNCRWATQTEQLRNQERNHLLSYQGTTQCIAAWAEQMGLNKSVIQGRLRLGWSVDRVLTTPVRPTYRTRSAA